jgi:hypothetical protein
MVRLFCCSFPRRLRHPAARHHPFREEWWFVGRGCIPGISFPRRLRHPAARHHPFREERWFVGRGCIPGNSFSAPSPKPCRPTPPGLTDWVVWIGRVTSGCRRTPPVLTGWVVWGDRLVKGRSALHRRRTRPGLPPYTGLLVSRCYLAPDPASDPSNGDGRGVRRTRC